MANGFWKRLGIVMACYVLLGLIFFFVVRDDWHKTMVATDAVNKDMLLQEMTSGTVLEQEILMETDQLHSLTLEATLVQGADPERHVSLSILDGDETLCDMQLLVGDFISGKLAVALPSPLEGYRGKMLKIRIEGEGGLAFWCGQTRTAGKFQVVTETTGLLTVNGEAVDGQLVYVQTGAILMPYADFILPLIILFGACLAGLMIFSHVMRQKGKPFVINKAIDLMKQYGYLLKVLVVRDFKVKYKASVLGILWSFLNPLLMTFVYMFVFSTIFRSSIEHFVVYLMSGIILFNYFSEATNLGMQSIVGNAGLITKVYIPKYIFPISKVLSSSINLAISLIPLLIMMALTGVAFRKSLLLIPLVLLFIVIFCAGVSLMLSACLVYFRDTQFIWGIMLTIWNFMTPIFYPESIIPARFITLYHMNPLYQFMYFFRTITLNGISPGPVTYLYCTLASGVCLAVGLAIFRKVQSRFVLHL